MLAPRHLVTTLVPLALLAAAGCACGDDDDDDDDTAGADAAAQQDAAGEDAAPGTDGGGEVDAEVPACADPEPARVLAVATGGGAGAATRGIFVVLTGTVPGSLEGSPLAAVEVGGSSRGVRWDPDRGLFSYLLARPAGEVVDLDVVARAESGATSTATVHVAVGPDDAVPGRDVAPDDHTIGSWMFSWFTGDPGWACGSPWRPVAGFEAWDGSVGWARGQLLDQMDARLDLVGLQLDTIADEGAQGYRFRNPMHVIDAARELLDEGFAPPRLLPFVDTAIVAEFFLSDTGRTLDLATDEGRDLLYSFFAIPWRELGTRLGPHAGFGGARYDGHPMVAIWHSVTLDGEDDAALRVLKERFAAELGAEPYLVAHPNDWRLYDEIDEVTLMFGPPEHLWVDGRDGEGRPTVNIEAGFWNPISNDFYLPREGGGHFDDAWTDALARQGDAAHLWIDSWNETGEGSGIFAAEPVDYAADDAGPCGTFVNRHAESWGPSARHYIDTVQANAPAWTGQPAWDASVVADDLPATLGAGERRWVTVVLRNAGSATWSFDDGPRLAAREGAEEFGVGTSPLLPDPALEAAVGGVPRGGPAAFPVLLTGPCTPGPHTLRLGLLDPAGEPFGADVTAEITVVAR